MAFFNKGRREALSKTLMNLVQISAGATLAGNIFMKLTIVVKILFIVTIGILLVLGVVICPERSDE